MNKVIVPANPIGGSRGYVQYSNHRDQCRTCSTISSDSTIQTWYQVIVIYLHNPVGQFLSNIHAIGPRTDSYSNSDILMATFTMDGCTIRRVARTHVTTLDNCEKSFPISRVVRRWTSGQKRSDELSELYEQILYPMEKSSDGRVLKSMRSPFVM